MGKTGLTKRKDGNYKVSLLTGRKPDGKPIRKYFYGRTMKEANGKLDEFKRMFSRGFVPTDERATFGELATLLCSVYKPVVSDGVRRRYESIFKNQLGDLSGVKVRELKAAHLQTIINRLAIEGLSSKTQKEIKQAAVQAMNLALDADIIVRNPFERVTITETEPVEREPLTDQQMKLLESNYKGHRLGLPAMIMMYAGLRRGELLALTWRDIDLKEKVIRINRALAFNARNVGTEKTPKTNAGTRDIPIFPPLYDALAAAPRPTNSILVCPAVSGAQMTNTAYRRGWENFMSYLNVQAGGKAAYRTKDANGKTITVPAVLAMSPFTAHQLRHTFVSLLYDWDTPVLVAQEWAGHASVEITLRIYTHLSQRKKDETVKKINARFLNGVEN